MQELFDYIRGALAKGSAKEDIARALRDAGWDPRQVSAVFAALKGGGMGEIRLASASTMSSEPVASPALAEVSANPPVILVVDDDENFREIFSAKLESIGFRVVAAKDGKEAILQAEKLLPSLILMDIHMPGETGTDVALKLKQNDSTKHIKIAFLTNLKEPWPAISGDRNKVAKELGMEDFLEKTEDLDVLVKKIQEILNTVPA